MSTIEKKLLNDIFSIVQYHIEHSFSIDDVSVIFLDLDSLSITSRRIEDGTFLSIYIEDGNIFFSGKSKTVEMSKTNGYFLGYIPYVHERDNEDYSDTEKEKMAERRTLIGSAIGCILSHILSETDNTISIINEIVRPCRVIEKFFC